jgi:hypothetical protein
VEHSQLAALAGMEATVTCIRFAIVTLVVGIVVGVVGSPSVRADAIPFSITFKDTGSTVTVESSQGRCVSGLVETGFCEIEFFDEVFSGEKTLNFDFTEADGSLSDTLSVQVKRGSQRDPRDPHSPFVPFFFVLYQSDPGAKSLGGTSMEELPKNIVDISSLGLPVTTISLFNDVDATPDPIPEPPTYVLLTTGFFALLNVFWRKRRFEVRSVRTLVALG